MLCYRAVEQEGAEVKPVIELRVSQDQYSSPSVVRIPIHPSAYERTWRPLDDPGPNADSFTCMICTPQPIIEQVKADREAFARLLAKAIVREMAGRDTLRGYPQQQSDLEPYVPSEAAIGRAP